MKKSSSLPVVLSMVMVAILILACAGGAAAPTATSVPSSTPLPTNTATATLRPTATPRPTATEIPPTPTPAPVGVPVRSDSVELTVIKVVNLERIYPGGIYLFTPNPGYLILDVGMHVKNLTGSVLSVKWSDVYLVESSGDSWYPLWGTYKTADAGETLDPFSFGISEQEIDGTDTINFVGDVYVRCIYIVTDTNPTNVLFGFYDSPNVAATVKK